MRLPSIRTRVVALCLVCFGAGCDESKDVGSSAPQALEDADVEAAVRLRSAAVVEAWNGGTLDDFVAFFDTGVILQSPGASASVGIDAVREAYVPVFEGARPKMAESIDSFEFSGELAVTTGRWTSADGAGYDNHTLTVWRRQEDGEWKILRWVYASAKG